MRAIQRGNVAGHIGVPTTILEDTIAGSAPLDQGTRPGADRALRFRCRMVESVALSSRPVGRVLVIRVHARAAILVGRR